MDPAVRTEALSKRYGATLTRDADKKVRALSKGNRRKVQLIAAARDACERG